MSDLDTATATLPLIEEQVTVGVREIGTTHVRVRTIVEEHPADAVATLARGDVQIDRRTVERPVSTAPEPFTDADGALIIPIVEERLVVEKRLFVVEELVVRATSRVEDVRVPATVRRMRAVVDRQDEFPNHEEEVDGRTE